MSDKFSFSGFLDYVVGPIYFWLLLLIYACYISAALGLWYVYPEYVHILTTGMQIFVAIVLLIRFNPFRPQLPIHHVDKQLIVASACMLLVNAGLAGALLPKIHL